jgi:euchromatic histone-lysine N-methyltransferase
MASPGLVAAASGGMPSLVGSVVRKCFGRAFFAGTVTSYDAATRWYLVSYEDGDAEELTVEELAPLLQPASLAADVQRTLAGGAPDDDDQDEEDAEDEAEPDEAVPPARGGRAIRKRGSSDDLEAAKPRGDRAKRSRPPPRRRGRGASSDGGSSDASGGSASGSEEDGSKSESREPWEDDGVTEDEAASSSEEEEEEAPPPPPRAAPKAAKAPKAAPSKQPPLRKGAVAAAPAGAETDVSESDGAAAAPSREAGKAAAAAIKAKAKAKAKEAAKHRVAGPVLTPGPAADAAVKASRAEFQRLLLLAVRSEDERFNACRGIGPDGKRLSRRADLVAFTALLNANGGVNQRPVVGHVPGIAIGVRFYGRAEVAAVGLHRHWLCGISYISKKESPYGAEVATSIVVSGGYEDDEDNGTDLTYTGQGGNDLLGRKKQLADQKWDRGNVAMRNAQQKGVPVRVIRANPDKQAPYGRVFIYDGLYDVIASEEKFGVSGCVSFAFLRCISRTTRHIKARRADSTARWD